MPTDKKIKKNIKSNLRKDRRLRHQDIDATVVEGIATLTGAVNDPSILKIAETDAYMAEGVRTVNNLLIVKDTQKGLTFPDDDELKNRVINSLSWVNQINSSTLRAEVKGGIVTVSGSVDAYWRKVLVKDLVQGAPGVVGVKDLLQVEPLKHTPDEAIAEEIRNALERNYQVDADRVTVRVNDGVVHLSGKVRSNLAARAAENSVQYTAGVKAIENRLKISAA